MKQLILIKYVLLSFLCICLSSCLTAGLDDDLPVYTEAEVTAFNFEYRWTIQEGISEKLQVKTLTAQTKINQAEGLIECAITVHKVSGTFTEEVRNQVSLSKLIGYATISTAASIAPVGSAPVLGKVGDFSQSDMVYEVTAADNKNKKQWRLVITSFTK